ncbi:MAG: hypothetical protein IPM79_01080 [Polyangiaceae bacterium]|jgi:hypothetical protein|nr:hypothetical protein [Polyangiaceae bacterium]MBK8936268.1 hypothetical protein [Polyangiaceae bacterium]
MARGVEVMRGGGRWAAVVLTVVGCAPAPPPSERPEASASAAVAQLEVAATSAASVAPSGSGSATPLPTAMGTATPIDATVAEPTKVELDAALAASIVAKGGTTTKSGVKILSDCVNPGPNAAARRGALGDDLPSGLSVDLDADGVPDRMFIDAAGMTLSVELYVMRGTCGHHVGSAKVRGGLDESVTEVKNGMRRLRFGGGCPVDCCETSLTFDLVWDGARYATHKKQVTRDCKRGAPSRSGKI